MFDREIRDGVEKLEKISEEEWVSRSSYFYQSEYFSKFLFFSIGGAALFEIFTVNDTVKRLGQSGPDFNRARIRFVYEIH